MKFFLKSIFAFVMVSSILFALDDQEEQLIKEAASQGYEKIVDIVELVYGQDFLSQGSKESALQMVAGLDLNGCKILDFGSGLGGPAFCLAKEYSVDVVGIEPQDWLVDRANKRLEEIKGDLKGTVQFIPTLYLSEFEDSSFDVVFSKEAILHVPYKFKESLFEEMYRVLKPGGSIVILDWMHASPNYSENTKKMMEIDGVAYNLITPDEYEDMLQRVGFTEICSKDMTAEHAMYSQENVETIRNSKSAIEAIGGEETYRECLTSWEYQRDAFLSQELVTGIFRAKKPTGFTAKEVITN